MSRIPPQEPQEQLPPHKETAELALLGCFLLDNSLLPEARNKHGVDSTLFYVPLHKEIFANFVRMSSEGLEISPSNYFMRFKTGVDLEDCRLREEICGSFFGRCDSECVSKENMPSWIEELKEFLDHRRTLAAAARTVDLLQNPRISAEQVRAQMEQLGEKLKSASKNGKHEEEFSVLNPDQITAMESNPADCILGDFLIAKGQPLVIAGEGGLGKSRLVTQMVTHCVINRDIFGFPTRGEGLRVLFMQTQNSCQRLKRDITGLRKHLGENDWERVKHLLFWHTLETEFDGYMNLDNQNNVDKCARLIARVKPDIIVWDPLADFAIGNINTDMDMAATFNQITKLTLAGNSKRIPVVIHHAGTGAIGALKAIGYDKSSFTRNSKVLFGLTRAQINVAPASPDNQNSMVLACGKNSNGKYFPTFAIKMDEDTFTYSIDPDFKVQDWIKSLDPKAKAKIPHLKTPDLSPLLSSKPLTLPQLREAVLDLKSCSRAAAYRLIERALTDGLIQYSSTDKDKIIMNPFPPNT